MSAISGAFDVGSPLYAPIATQTSGATIISGVTGRKLRVMSMNVIASIAVNVKWQTQTGPADLTGFAYLATNGGYILPYNQIGWFETLAGDSLNINLSAGISVGGSLTFVTF